MQPLPGSCTFSRRLGGAAEIQPPDPETAGPLGSPVRIQGAARDILEHAKKCCHAGRYTCVNLQNSSTIEFRIFRGTLKYNTFLAALQMVNRICDVAIFCLMKSLRPCPGLRLRPDVRRRS